MATQRRPEKSDYLSGYRLVWLMVLFDLPVVEKAERNQATRFRKDLLDRGFEMRCSPSTCAFAGDPSRQPSC